jgi:hypothetical protein
MVYGWFGAVRCSQGTPRPSAMARRLPKNKKVMTSGALKTLRDMKCADLPVLQSTKFELVINLQIAKALDIHVPSDVRVLTFMQDRKIADRRPLSGLTRTLSRRSRMAQPDPCRTSADNSQRANRRREPSLA